MYTKIEIWRILVFLTSRGMKNSFTEGVLFVSLTYLIISILFALLMLVGCIYMILLGTTGFFVDFLEWFTNSLDIGSNSSRYTFGGLVVPIGCIIAFCSLFVLVISIVSFVLSVIRRMPKELTFKISIVLYSVNSVLMFLTLLMSISCDAWHILSNVLSEANKIVYAGAALGVMLWIVSTILAVLNLVRMKKKLNSVCESQ